MPAWLLSTLAVLLTFGLVIFLHELGHFIVCKWLGIRVIRFAFGFGPEVFGVTSHGTRFSACAVPLGGYVKPAGESIEDCTGHPDEYFSRSPWQRLAIVAAGPVMNYFLAFLLFFAVVAFHGMPEASTEPIVGEIAAGLPAQKAGLKDGDVILAVDAVEVKTWAELAALIHRSADKKVIIEYRREGKPAKAETTPQFDAALGRGLIGIKPKMVFVRVGFLRSVQEGLFQCWFWTEYTVQTLYQKIRRRERPDLAGPVGIVQMVSKAARSGLEELVFLIALISVAIGFFNLLPIPLLDGGHAVLYLWEGLSRRKLTMKTMAVVNSIGLALLVSILIFATYNDVLRLRESRKAGKGAAEGTQTPPGDPAPAPVQPQAK
ncbi:MAG: site-2 protease family protein [Elusimicrobia bacterium]|nr:site-2 protease family protein [Elusimicrobiota bacterium]